jgi:hypothetical protein
MHVFMTPGCLNISKNDDSETWFVIATKTDDNSAVATVLTMRSMRVESVRCWTCSNLYEIVIGEHIKR